MDEIELQRRVREFVRAFGLLADNRTPCGRPLSPSQAHALQVLGERGGITQKILAERLNLDKSTTSRLVGQLIERGWITRTRSSEDQREARLGLSSQGGAVLGEIEQASAARFREILHGIPTEKRPQVLEALQLLVAALRPRVELAA